MSADAGLAKPVWVVAQDLTYGCLTGGLIAVLVKALHLRRILPIESPSRKLAPFGLVRADRPVRSSYSEVSPLPSTSVNTVD